MCIQLRKREMDTSVFTINTDTPKVIEKSRSELSLLRLQINTAGFCRDVHNFEVECHVEALNNVAVLASTRDEIHEWLDRSGHRFPKWMPITVDEPAPLEDVMVTVFAPGNDEPLTFMAYRKTAGSIEFYLRKV